jgi:hypothetical protein
MAHEEEVKIEFKGEGEIVINDSTTIKNKPLVTYLRHVFNYLLGPRDGEVTVTRDYYDERVASYVISQDGEETSIYIGEDGVEVNGTEVRSKLLAKLLRHALGAYIFGDGESEIEEREGVYYIRTKTLGD